MVILFIILIFGCMLLIQLTNYKAVLITVASEIHLLMSQDYKTWQA